MRLPRREHLPWIALAVGIACLMTALATSTVGLHCDENQYLWWGRTNPQGDADRFGIPPLFFWINYRIYHWLAWIAGPWRPVFPFLFYQTATVLSLTYLARRLTDTAEEYAWLFLVLLLYPLTLHVNVHFMTEIVVLPLITLAFGALVEMARSGPSRRAQAVLLATGTLAVTFKSTAVPAMAALAMGFFPLLGKRVWTIGLAIIVGTIFSRITLAINGLPHMTVTGSPANLFNLDHLRSRLPSTGMFFWFWLFTVWPPTVAAALWAARAKQSFRTPFLALAGISLLATHAIQLMITQDHFTRYTFPVVWVGIIALVHLALRCPRWVKALILLSCFIPTYDMWRNDEKRFSLWPPVVTEELHYSAWTVFQGSPIWRWVLFSPEKRKRVCAYVPQAGADKAGFAVMFLRYVSDEVFYFDERNAGEFSSCPGAPAVARHQYQENPLQCDPECPPEYFRYENCSTVEMRSGGARFVGRLLTNRTCLP